MLPDLPIMCPADGSGDPADFLNMCWMDYCPRPSTEQHLGLCENHYERLLNVDQVDTPREEIDEA